MVTKKIAGSQQRTSGICLMFFGGCAALMTLGMLFQLWVYETYSKKDKFIFSLCILCFFGVIAALMIWYGDKIYKKGIKNLQEHDEKQKRVLEKNREKAEKQ